MEDLLQQLIAEAAGPKFSEVRIASQEAYDFLLSAYRSMYMNLADDGSIYVWHADTEGLNFRKAFKDAGNKVYMIMGARNKDLIFWKDKMEKACDELFITTDDGTMGRKGFVTSVVEEIIAKEKIDLVMAVGPMPMMRAVCNLTKEPQIKTIVSMNPIMVDGTGMCGACRLTVGGETKFACVDGPDFDGHLVDFDEVIARTSIYKPQEKQRNEIRSC